MKNCYENFISCRSGQKVHKRAKPFYEQNTFIFWNSENRFMMEFHFRREVCYDVHYTYTCAIKKPNYYQLLGSLHRSKWLLIIIFKKSKKVLPGNGEKEKHQQLLKGYHSEVMEMFWNRQRRWLHNTVNALNATELLTSKWLILHEFHLNKLFTEKSLQKPTTVSALSHNYYCKLKGLSHDYCVSTHSYLHLCWSLQGKQNRKELTFPFNSSKLYIFL